ncbi:hypothetical protein BV98_001446 [Sphingobium herbicidovorans NBRC 16415]|uniref:DUF3168 domain-containing protein n=1 Tax=Sphingobium herbicidovorans (strain ATCC 700291 / DSM 11019 / CCUG 56400 / KCTC 2939 / LMG 18315 / NBRC 16415 / MH) TaxID=1219045 RepID=A0A086PBG6_SPHHM|nr:DUF3168 domain-containing protein [Sphingobium herbicidovorans]KFG90734.1 hypothetical protein BV98_001446 [Sphingobium herbicidovorans NBRC 16415]
MEADLIARLLADAGLAALIGNRVTPVSRVQGEALPALTLTKVAPGRAYTFSGADGTHGTLMQFDAWALSAAAAKAVATALTAILETPATSGGTIFGMSFLQSERDGHEDVPGVGTVFRVSADFLIWWQPL